MRGANTLDVAKCLGHCEEGVEEDGVFCNFFCDFAKSANANRNFPRQVAQFLQEYR